MVYIAPINAINVASIVGIILFNFLFGTLPKKTVARFALIIIKAFVVDVGRTLLFIFNSLFKIKFDNDKEYLLLSIIFY
jgi:hypothetical protein